MSTVDKDEMAERAEQRAAHLAQIRVEQNMDEDPVLARAHSIAEQLAAGVGPIGAEPPADT